MKRPRRRNPLALALYLNAALLLAILAALLARDSHPPMLPMAMAQAQPAGGAVGGGAGVFVMPAQFSDNIWGCYILDLEQQTLCAYHATGTPQKLKLIAARDIRYDRRLRNYNTGTPSPQEVQDLVAKEASSSRVTDRPSPPPISPEQAPQSK